VKRNCYYSGPTSDHFDGARFFNNAPATRDRSVRDLLRWYLTSRPDPGPARQRTNLIVPEVRSTTTRITVVGHATVLIQACGLNLVTDPVWSARPYPVSFLGPKRVSPPAIAFDDLPPIDAVLLSHNHYDHLDMVTLNRLVNRDRPLILTPLGNGAIVDRFVEGARIASGDWWYCHRLADDVEVTIVPAQHWSLRRPWDRRMALWSGFAMRIGRELIYFAGDTGYGDGSVFNAIKRRVGRPNVALLPIGAYEPSWLMADQHLNPSEAVRIFQDLEAQEAIGIHWGVFRLTDEGRDEPREALARALAEQRIEPTRFLAAVPGLVWNAPN
jgi:L-ascorbate metabolism protein UlaG (beta-lactamase superfamily)